MSAGEFARARYEANSGIIYSVKIQPETETLILNSEANTRPAALVTLDIPSARVSGSRRQIGMNTRMVRFRFTGSVPDGYADKCAILSLPVLRIDAFNAYIKDSDGTYTIGGTAYPVAYVGKTGETLI